jgi:hypothetical protein
VFAAVKPESHFVLMSHCRRVQRGEKASGAWTFLLRRQIGWTRLIVRGSGGAIGHSFFDIPHFAMEQKMMRGIRDRAERARREQTAALIREEYQSIQHEQLDKPVKSTTLVK